MLNKELNTLLQSLNAVNNLKGNKLAYAVSKNKKLIMSKLDELQVTIKPSEKFIEYDKQRIKSCEEYASKDKDGKPSVVNHQYTFSEDNKKKFDAVISRLNEKYSAEIEEKEKMSKEFEKLLDKESSFKPFMIDYNDVPEDITVNQMDGIIEIIKEKKNE